MTAAGVGGRGAVAGPEPAGRAPSAPREHNSAAMRRPSSPPSRCWACGSSSSAASGVPTYIAPSPVQVAQVFVEQGDVLWINFWPTLLEAMAGFALGNTIAVLLAVWFVHNRLAERAFYPIAVFINTIPIIAVAPILVLMLGNGYAPKIVIAALICFFPTLVNMVRG